MDAEAEVHRVVADEVMAMTSPERMSELVGLVDGAICEAFPVIGDDPGLRQDLGASTLAALRRFLPAVSSDEVGSIPLPQATTDLGRSLAVRGIEIGVLLGMYRVAQRVLWSVLMRVLYAGPYTEDVRRDALERMWDFVNGTVEGVLQEAVAAYQEEAQRQLSGAVVRRQETVATLLRGGALDLAVTSKRLGHPLERPQLAAVLWADPEIDMAEAGVQLDRLARRIGAAIGAPTLLVPAGARAAWAWYAVGTDALEDDAWSSVRAAVPEGLRAALAGPRSGTFGFRTTHEDAIRAQKMMSAIARPDAVVRYEEIELVSLLAADRTALGNMVRRELGGLAADDPALARIRETVLVYFAKGSSIRAAEALSIHKNTVLYRLNRAEELLGYPVGERRLALEVALTAAHALGPAAWA